MIRESPELLFDTFVTMLMTITAAAQHTHTSPHSKNNYTHFAAIYPSSIALKPPTRTRFSRSLIPCEKRTITSGDLRRNREHFGKRRRKAREKRKNGKKGGRCARWMFR